MFPKTVGAHHTLGARLKRSSPTAAKVVIPVIDKVFAEFGVQRVLKSGNGSPFQSDDFPANFVN